MVSRAISILIPFFLFTPVFLFDQLTMSSSENTFTTPIVDNINTTTQALLTINMSNVTKLTASNYLMWSLKIHALLDGYDLAGYIDGLTMPPSPTLTTDDQITVNPAHTLWKRQDRLIFSAIIGAITAPLQPLISRAATSYEAWTTLASTYAKPSRGHIKQLKTQLKNWKKENKTVDVYLQGITTRLDQLAILGKAVDHEDQIDLILEGLPDDYKTIVDQIEGRDAPPSITELHERLLNHEAKLQLNSDAAFSPAPVAVNMTQTRGNNNNYKHPNKPRSNTQWSSQSPQQYPRADYNNKGPRPYLGKCQIWGTQGHNAKRCSQLTSFQQANLQQTLFQAWNPRANYIAAAPYNAANWLLDSGATHHITSDLANLSLHQPYQGSNEVMVADGSQLLFNKLVPSLS